MPCRLYTVRNNQIMHTKATRSHRQVVSGSVSKPHRAQGSRRLHEQRQMRNYLIKPRPACMTYFITSLQCTTFKIKAHLTNYVATGHLCPLALRVVIVSYHIWFCCRYLNKSIQRLKIRYLLLHQPLCIVIWFCKKESK